MSSIEKVVRRLWREGAAREVPARADSVPGTGEVQLLRKGPTSPGNPHPLELDLKALRRANYLARGSVRAKVAEQYRHLKRPILNIAFGNDPGALQHRNVIAVTSAVGGEGKTFTALNLALSIAAEHDVWVLLVDADPIHQSFTRLVGLKGHLGLLDILSDREVGVAAAIRRTTVDKLSVVPAGRPRENTTELFASQRMRSITGELCSRHSDRVVLLDSPPVLAASEAVVLSSLAGQTVFVVEEGGTPQRVVRDALSLLDRSGVVGMVLTKSVPVLGSGYLPYYGEP